MIKFAIKFKKRFRQKHLLNRADSQEEFVEVLLFHKFWVK